MLAPRAIAAFFRLLAVATLLCPAGNSAEIPIVPPGETAAAQVQATIPQSSQNIFAKRLSALDSLWAHANAPQAAVLLARFYRLRDFVDAPNEIARRFEQVAGDVQQHPLVRDEALHYLALIDVHNKRLPAASAKLKALGLVREWAVAGPFSAPQGLDGDPGLEASAAWSAEHQWRRLPVGPMERIDLAKMYPYSRPSMLLAETSIYSEREQAVALRFTAESAVAVVLNGTQIFAEPVKKGGLGFDQHAVSAHLHFGWNTLLLKLARGADGPWRFSLRITALEGGGLPLPASPEMQSVTVPRDNPAIEQAPPEAFAAPADLVDMAKAASAADPTSASALDTLGQIEREHACGSELEHLEAAAQRAPTAERWLAMAEACGDSTCVFRALNSALRSDPENEAARVALANYYSGRNQLQKARDLLRQAVRLEPGDFVARNGLADLYAAVGLNAQALEETGRLQHDFPGPLWLKCKLADRYFDLGLLDRALPLVQAALTQDYDAIQPRSLLVQIAQRRHDVQLLRTADEDLARLNPADPFPLADLAELAAGAGDHDAADRALRAALELAPEDGNLRERAANLLARSGSEDKEAAQQLARAVELNPHNEAARTRLRLLAPANEQADKESTYLVDPAELAAAAHREPPAITGKASLLANVRIERVFGNGLSVVRQHRVVAVTQASNVLGVVTPVKDIAKICHDHDALLLVDGAQAVPHMPVNVEDIGCDFYRFSGDKTTGNARAAFLMRSLVLNR